MKFLKIFFLINLLSTQCFGMKSTNPLKIISPLNPNAAKILGTLKEADANNSLNADVFWKMMKFNTTTKSYFLGESFEQVFEEDLCLILRYLIIFGRQDKNSFFKSMSECCGINEVLPLNELIKRMPNDPSKNSELCELFLELLNLIRTLDSTQKLVLLTQSTILTAKNVNKLYIVNALSEILFDDSKTTLQTNADRGTTPPSQSPDLYPQIGYWDGRNFLLKNNVDLYY